MFYERDFIVMKYLVYWFNLVLEALLKPSLAVMFFKKPQKRLSALQSTKHLVHVEVKFSRGSLKNSYFYKRWRKESYRIADEMVLYSCSLLSPEDEVVSRTWEE